MKTYNRPEISAMEIDRFVNARNKMREEFIRSTRTRAVDAKTEIMPITRWLTRVELFSPLRMVNDEQKYVLWVKWLLSPETLGIEHAVRLQNQWLNSMQIGLTEEIDNSAELLWERRVGNGRIDLILHYPGLLVVGIEAKTTSDEHLTDGEYQTFYYPKHLHKTVKEPVSTPLEIVFLTLNGKSAKNPDAKLTTFSSLATLFALASEPEEMVDQDVIGTLKVLITHFIDSNSEIKQPITKFLELEPLILSGEEVEIQNVVQSEMTREYLLELADVNND